MGRVEEFKFPEGKIHYYSRFPWNGASGAGGSFKSR